jgi:putative tryptophan/tyrosine transport system substrate-binding protein
VISRREFITLLGGAAAWPLAARAQQKLPTIGYLGSTPRGPESQRDAALLQRLRELGWTEGRTVAIEYRWAENRMERYAEIATEFVRLKVDVIVTFGTAVPAFKQATSAIPIVFTIDADPVGRGLVASLARPGNNVTGLSAQSTDLVGKRLEILRELLPKRLRLAVMANVGFPGAVQETAEVQMAAAKLDHEVVVLEVRRAEDIAAAFESLKGIDALYVCGDLLTFTNRTRISTFAQSARLPTIHGTGEFVEAGGLVSYGVNYVHLYRRAAEHIDKILRGTKPADIPIEQPTKFDLVINLASAKALGLEVPPTLLARADEVIE